jgi:transcriptional regulator with PAS, ATPase and Fis domain
MENPERCQTRGAGPAGLDWERIIDALPDGLIVTDRQYTLVFANPAACRIAAKSAEEIAGVTCHQAFDCALCHTPACPLTRLREKGGHLQYETDSHCKVHQTPWMVTASAYYDAAGEFAGMVERISDGSTLLSMRSQLFNSRERLRKNMGAIIQAMSTTIEKRDPYTAGHQRRVAKLCRAIATEMGFAWEGKFMCRRESSTNPAPCPNTNWPLSACIRGPPTTS